MIDQEALASAIEGAAELWKDPAYPAREQAVADTLLLENRFTEQALAFAINQQMALLVKEDLLKWVAGRVLTEPRTVGVLNAGNIPFVGLQDWLAVVLTGAAYRGVLSSKSPYLLPAFVLDVVNAFPDLDLDFIEFDSLEGEVDGLIASGSDETIQVLREKSKEMELGLEQCLFRGHKYSMAVIRGNETPAEREKIAEDVLLHEGMGCRSVSIIWAPEELAPDAYLESLAHFRGVFPPHEKTPASLKMKRAFLDAIGASHAYGDGMEFLVSKGEPEQQEPGHVRWATYRTLQELAGWMEDHKEEIQLVFASKNSAEQLNVSVPVLPFGSAQRPTLSWCPDGIDTIAFLQSL